MYICTNMLNLYNIILYIMTLNTDLNLMTYSTYIARTYIGIFNNSQKNASSLVHTTQ